MRLEDEMRIVKEKKPPIVSFVGNSGSGKTTLLERLISQLTHKGLRMGTIKHDVHGFEMDKPGKDSWRHKQAGAVTTIISSPFQVGMVMDVECEKSPEDLLTLMSDLDLVLTEGYKTANLPKIEIFRSQITKAPLCRNDQNLIAYVSDEIIDLPVPRFSPDDTEALADFLINHFGLTAAHASPPADVSHGIRQ